MARRKLARILGLGVLGVVAGLAVSELVFRARDGGAFPQLNVFVADPVLGVRLRPGATETVRFGGPKNPATSVRIGSHGYRGEERPPSADETLVVGDSQVFGLGVEEDETFAGILEKTSWRSVINLGVPTYGPAEYTSVLEEALASRPPKTVKTVVWTVNLVNDLFERARPNRDRHSVYDGWAVRKEHAPASPSAWPLLGQSHLVYAFRRATLTTPVAAPSEGTFADLVEAAPGAPGPGVEASSYDAAVERFRVARDALDEAMRSVRTCESGGESYDCIDAAGAAIGPTTLYPGGEGARDIEVTVDHLRRAALIRSYEAGAADALAYVEKDPAVKAAGLAHREARAALLALQPARAEFHARPSPLTPEFQKLAELAKTHAVRMIVLVLPIDVMVSAEEWRKYGRDPAQAPKLDAARAFVDDLVASARDVGLEALDASPVLAAAEPGAFLDADIHLTPKGHAAVADALGKVMKASPEPRAARPGLPPGRTAPEGLFPWTIPALDALTARPDYECPVRIKDEWISFACNASYSGKSSLFGTNLEQGEGTGGWYVRVRSGGLGEVLPAKASVSRFFAAPVLEGTPLEVELRSGVARGRVLRATRDAAGHVDVKLGPIETLPEIAMPSSFDRDCTEANDTFGPNDEDCLETYDRRTCSLLLACRRGSLTAPPQCRPGFVATGATSRCHPRCGATYAECTGGTTCQEWQGVHACW